MNKYFLLTKDEYLDLQKQKSKVIDEYKSKLEDLEKRLAAALKNPTKNSSYEKLALYKPLLRKFIKLSREGRDEGELKPAPEREEKSEREEERPMRSAEAALVKIEPPATPAAPVEDVLENQFKSFLDKLELEYAAREKERETGKRKWKEDTYEAMPQEEVGFATPPPYYYEHALAKDPSASSTPLTKRRHISASAVGRQLLGYEGRGNKWFSL